MFVKRVFVHLQVQNLSGADYETNMSQKLRSSPKEKKKETFCLTDSLEVRVTFSWAGRQRRWGPGMRDYCP